MCLIAWSWRHHPRFALIIAANRDEYHERPTDAAGFWAEQPSLVAGRDRLAGGTWLGLTRTGRFAALTNYREPEGRPGRQSRGLLVRDFLRGHESPADYARRIAACGDDYAGFNLMIGDMSGLYYTGNRNGGCVALERGLDGLSNALLNTPWPKLHRLKTALGACRRLRNPRSMTHELMAALADTTPAASIDLPATGVSPEREIQLSSPFVVGADYGTRCSTVILVDRDGQALFSERSFAGLGVPTDWRELEFSLRPDCYPEQYDL